MKKKQDIQWEEFTKKVDEFCDVIKNLDTSISKSLAADCACYKIIARVAESHYEGLGILQEVMMFWREESLKALCDECENVDNH